MCIHSKSCLVACMIQSKCGEWPLYVAAKHGHLDLMKELEEVCKLVVSVSCQIRLKVAIVSLSSVHLLVYVPLV